MHYLEQFSQAGGVVISLGLKSKVFWLSIAYCPAYFKSAYLDILLLTAHPKNSH